MRFGLEVEGTKNRKTPREIKKDRLVGNRGGKQNENAVKKCRVDKRWLCKRPLQSQSGCAKCPPRMGLVRGLTWNVL
jgi:hypothetical protein